MVEKCLEEGEHRRLLLFLMGLMASSRGDQDDGGMQFVCIFPLLMWHHVDWVLSQVPPLSGWQALS